MDVVLSSKNKKAAEVILLRLFCAYLVPSFVSSYFFIKTVRKNFLELFVLINAYSNFPARTPPKTTHCHSYLHE